MPIPIRPKLIQHRQEFRLGSFFKCLSVDGPYVTVKTEIGQFPDMESARQKAQEMLAEDSRLAFAIVTETGNEIRSTKDAPTFICDYATGQKEEDHHERIGQRMQRVVLLTLGWLAIGWFNDGFFTVLSLVLTGIMATLFLLGSTTFNRVESLVLWFVLTVNCILFHPTYRMIQDISRHQSGDQPAAVPVQMSPASNH